MLFCDILRIPALCQNCRYTMDIKGIRDWQVKRALRKESPSHWQIKLKVGIKMPYKIITLESKKANTLSYPQGSPAEKILNEMESEGWKLITAVPVKENNYNISFIFR